MIVDGRALAAARKEIVRSRRERLGALSLGVLLSEGDAATASFVRIKKRVAESLGVSVVEYPLAVDTEEGALYRTLDAAAAAHHGVIVQLPLAPALANLDVQSRIPESKDVDVVSDSAFNAFANGSSPVAPPVASALRVILEAHNIPVSGKSVAVVGKGLLVGKPAAALFTQMGATVRAVSRGDDVSAVTKDADIVVLGAGMPHILAPHMVKEGVVVLDAGTSESNGVVVGDADPAVAEKASLFTPVPGGVGPLAVAEIFHNLVLLAERNK